MAVENLSGPTGLTRLDIVQQSIARGEDLAPTPLARVVSEAVPTRPTNRERKAWKTAWPGLQRGVKEELGQ